MINTFYNRSLKLQMKELRQGGLRNLPKELASVLGGSDVIWRQKVNLEVTSMAVVLNHDPFKKKEA